MKISNSEIILNVASLATHTRALGPGIRSVIWVQGCPIDCKGCIAPDWIPMKSAMQLSPAAIIERLLFDDITGLTFSGGEPMEQAAGLAEVARLARRQQDIDIICFSGYRYERLLKNPPNPAVTRLLAEVDVLIDGPFIESRNDSVGLRGSSNQRVIHLTSKLRTHELESDSRRVEMRITNGELVLIGIPTPAIASAIATASSTALGRTVSNERL